MVSQTKSDIQPTSKFSKRSAAFSLAKYMFYAIVSSLLILIFMLLILLVIYGIPSIPKVLSSRLDYSSMSFETKRESAVLGTAFVKIESKNKFEIRLDSIEVELFLPNDDVCFAKGRATNCLIQPETISTIKFNINVETLSLRNSYMEAAYLLLISRNMNKIKMLISVKPTYMPFKIYIRREHPISIAHLSKFFDK